MKHFVVWEYVPEWTDQPGKAVKGKWVDTRRPDGVRSRLVAMEIAFDARNDTHAGTPPLVLTRLILSRAASRKGRYVSIYDVTCTFLHADMDESIFVKLPAGLCPPGFKAKLLKALYGTRRASLLWGDNIKEKFLNNGFRQAKGCSQFYWHPDKDIWAIVHGDGFLVESDSSSADWMDEMMVREFKTKIKARLGEGGNLEANFLHRTVRYVPGGGFEYEPDSKHTKLAAKYLGLENAKVCATPMVKDGGNISNVFDKLKPGEAALYASITGRVVYLAVDRYDIEYVVRILAQDLKGPNELSMMRLKRLVKYVLGTMDQVWSFPFQEWPEIIDVYSDSDWAKNQTTRRSVSSGLLKIGHHAWETWVVGQQVVSLSSGEAEFYAAGKSAAHALFLLYLLREAGLKMRCYLHTDSTACRGVCGRQGPGKIKHMQTRFLWLQERVRSRGIETKKIPGERHPSDLGTKTHTEERTKMLLKICGFAKRGTTGSKSIGCLVFYSLVTCGSAASVAVVEPFTGVQLVADVLPDNVWSYLIGILMFWIIQRMFGGHAVYAMERMTRRNREVQTELSGGEFDELLRMRDAAVASASRSGSSCTSSPSTSYQQGAPPPAPYPVQHHYQGQSPACVACDAGATRVRVPGQSSLMQSQRASYEAMTVRGLRQILSSRGLSGAGLKLDLIDRLMQADGFQQQTNAAFTPVIRPTAKQTSFIRVLEGRHGVSAPPEVFMDTASATLWLDEWANQ